MEWLNLHMSHLRSPAYIGSSPVERNTWISVLAYSVEQENGGRLVGAMAWKDRQWQQACGVTRREVMSATKLLEIDGDDVVVRGYPCAKEREVQAKREAGRNGGMAKTEAKTEAAKANGMLGGRPRKTQAETETEPKAKPNGREGKGREGEGEGACEAPTPPPDQVRIENRQRLAKTLRLHGLQATEDRDGQPGTLSEWSDLLQGRGACRCVDDALDGIAWIIRTAGTEGSTIRYAREAAPYADRWAGLLARRKDQGREGAA